MIGRAAGGCPGSVARLTRPSATKIVVEEVGHDGATERPYLRIAAGVGLWGRRRGKRGQNRQWNLRFGPTHRRAALDDPFGRLRRRFDVIVRQTLVVGGDVEAAAA